MFAAMASLKSADEQKDHLPNWAKRIIERIYAPPVLDYELTYAGVKTEND